MIQGQGEVSKPKTGPPLTLGQVLQGDHGRAGPRQPGTSLLLPQQDGGAGLQEEDPVWARTCHPAGLSVSSHCTGLAQRGC